MLSPVSIGVEVNEVVHFDKTDFMGISSIPRALNYLFVPKKLKVAKSPKNPEEFLQRSRFRRFSAAVLKCAAGQNAMGIHFYDRKLRR